MSEYPKNVKFPVNKSKSFTVPINKGLNCVDIINADGFSQCENISYNKHPVLSSSDIRKSIHSQMSYYNLTSPSTVFKNDGGANIFSFGDYILLIHWGMCGEDVEDGYQYVRDGRVVNRDYKKGCHYVICDCIKYVKNTFIHLCSCVLYDENEEKVYNCDYEMYADPRTYIEASQHPDEMDNADITSVYLYDGTYYYFDEGWLNMKLNRTYFYKAKLFYYDSYLGCWLVKRAYSDKNRDAKLFSEWSSDDPSMMFGSYRKYIMIMPDAVLIELDESGFPKEDTYFDGEMITSAVQKSDRTTVYSIKKRPLEACMTDSDGTTRWFSYPDVTCILPCATRMFAVGDGRIYATKPNTPNDFTYDSVYSFMSSNAWAASVSNEGVSSSKLCAIFDYSGEIIVFSKDTAYKIYGQNNPFRVGTLFKYGTFSQKSVTECCGDLYFVDSKGIYCYNGTSIECISDKLQTGRINNAIITSCNNTVYIYLDCDMDKVIYTYDIRYKAFLKIALPYDSYITSQERKTKDIVDMISLKDNVYILTYASYDTRPGGDNTVNSDTAKRQIYCITSGSAKYLGYKERWFFETNPFNKYIPDMQQVKEVQIVLKGDVDSYIKVYLLSPGELPDDKNLITEHQCGKNISVLRYSLRKSEALYHRLYVEGEGDVDIHSIELKLSCGGDKFESE